MATAELSRTIVPPSSAPPRVESWANRIATAPPIEMTDVAATDAYQAMVKARGDGNSFFCAGERGDQLFDFADDLEVQLRRAKCSTNRVASIKLLIFEHSQEDGETEDDPRLLRQVIFYLAEVC